MITLRPVQLQAPHPRRRVWLYRALAVSLGLAGGCVRAPEVAVVSEHTALERQAAGEYPVQEQALATASISPGPTPIPREQLGGARGASELGVVDEMVAHAESDEDRVDALLLAACVGEASTGLLAVTSESCRQEIDPNEVARLVGRVNVHRRQVWSFVAAQSPGTSEAQAQARWRVLHLQRVVCGAQVQADAGAWESKACPQ